jgi:hypothetical protein
MLVSIPPSYRKDLPPTKSLTDIVNVTVNFHLAKIYNIKELDSSFSAGFALTMVWTDNRIHFDNLKDNKARNIVGNKFRKDMWMPSLTFINTDLSLGTIVDDKTEIVVDLQGKGHGNSVSEVRENLIFTGAENPMVMSRYYSLAFECDFKLQMFPFDVQECVISIKPAFDQLEYVALTIGNVTRNEDLSKGQFDFEELHHFVLNGTEIIMDMDLKRIIYYHLATTYLPTCCLIIIAEMTLIIDKSHFEATIMVALTSMLVMYTLYQSVADTLPQTAYLKMIDIWLLAGLILPFFVVMVQIAVDTVEDQCSNSEDEVQPYKANSKFTLKRQRNICLYIIKFTKFLIPLGSLIFAIVYWTIALIHYHKK